MVTCKVCGLLYVPGLDTREHNATHAKFLALSDMYAEPRFGGHLWLYPQREKEKLARDVIGKRERQRSDSLPWRGLPTPGIAAQLWAASAVKKPPHASLNTAP
jgi:hypothetical protein